jgi:hypothetical protein
MNIQDTARGMRPAGWSVVAAALITIGLLLHALFPRYTLTTVGQDGAVVFVFDRWTGQFQRATYGPDGEPKVTSVVKPF